MNSKVRVGQVYERRNKWARENYGKYINIIGVDYNPAKKRGSQCPLIMGLRSDTLDFSLRDAMIDEMFDRRRYKLIKESK